MPRILLHHIIFDHGLVFGSDQPRLQGNQLCRKGWLQLREIARSGWVILPVQEVAAYPWCTVREHVRSGNCPEARQAKWAHVGFAPWYRCADKVDGPCTRGLDSICDSEPEHTGSGTSTRLGRLLPECARNSAFASAYCTVPAAVPTARAFRFSPDGSPRRSTPWSVSSPECDWLSLRGSRENRKRHLRSRRCQLLTAAPGNETSQHRAKHQKSVHSENHFFSCSVEPLFARSIFAQEPAGAETPMSAPAAVWAPRMAERNIILEAVAELPDSCETVPTRWPEQEESQLSRYHGGPKRDRRRHRRSGEL